MRPIYSGKVREIYDISKERLVIVTTDRVSAFDRILSVPIKDKGIVLNTLSNFWFGMTGDIVQNHILEKSTDSMPPFFHDEYFRDRTVMVKKLKMLPFEFVVRGYIFGSMWEAYKNGREFCGIRFSENYEQAQQLAEPVITPALKHDKGHDEYVGISVVRSQLGEDMTKQIADICRALYDRCSRYALSKGLIIADAKFEFGIDSQGQLVLADEIFTPDSSRFWDMADYRVGSSPRSYDKQLLRDWLSDNKENGELQFDKIPQSIISQTQMIYRECLRRIVGITI